jgi:hypothetical protein
MIFFITKTLSSRFLAKNLKSRIYRTMLLSVALYGCETVSLILKEKRRLIVFENSILRRLFGHKRMKMGSVGGFETRNSCSLYRSRNVVREIKSRRLTWARYRPKVKKVAVFSKF